MGEYPVAPSLEGVTSWIHSVPLDLTTLKGSVIALAFFSYGCGNCQRFMPEMQKLYEKYAKEGFHLIGIHSPEYEREKQLVDVKAFLMKNHLTFPVAVDNELAIWNTYKNQYWPTLYLIDKNGMIRERHIGEGGYHRLSHDIAHLLHEK